MNQTSTYFKLIKQKKQKINSQYSTKRIHDYLSDKDTYNSKYINKKLEINNGQDAAKRFYQVRMGRSNSRDLQLKESKKVTITAIQTLKSNLQRARSHNSLSLSYQLDNTTY